jgi:oligopeptide transport system permease protein
VILLAFLVPLLPVAAAGSWRHLVLPVARARRADRGARRADRAHGDARDALPGLRARRARQGLPERIVLLRHALPGALVPVASFLGPAAAGV